MEAIDAALKDSVMKAMKNRRRTSHRGFWITVDVIDENDDALKIECLVDVTEEADPYGTGDSPTAYEVEIIRCIAEGDDFDSDAFETQIEQAAIEEFKG